MGYWDDVKAAAKAKYEEAKANFNVGKDYVGSQVIGVVAPNQKAAMQTKMRHDAQKATAAHRQAAHADARVAANTRNGINRRVDATTATVKGAYQGAKHKAGQAYQIARTTAIDTGNTIAQGEQNLERGAARKYDQATGYVKGKAKQVRNAGIRGYQVVKNGAIDTGNAIAQGEQNLERGAARKYDQATGYVKGKAKQVRNAGVRGYQVVKNGAIDTGNAIAQGEQNLERGAARKYDQATGYVKGKANQVRQTTGQVVRKTKQVGGLVGAVVKNEIALPVVGNVLPGEVPKVKQKLDASKKDLYAATVQKPIEGARNVVKAGTHVLKNEAAVATADAFLDDPKAQQQARQNLQASKNNFHHAVGRYSGTTGQAVAATKAKSQQSKFLQSGQASRDLQGRPMSTTHHHHTHSPKPAVVAMGPTMTTPKGPRI